MESRAFVYSVILKKLLLYKKNLLVQKRRSISDVMVVQFVLMKVHVSLLTIIKIWSIFTRTSLTHTLTHTLTHRLHSCYSERGCYLFLSVGHRLMLNKYKGSLCHVALLCAQVCVSVCVCVSERYILSVCVGYYQCDCVISCVLAALDPPAMWASSLLASQRWMVEVHLSHSASGSHKTCRRQIAYYNIDKLCKL